MLFQERYTVEEFEKFTDSNIFGKVIFTLPKHVIDLVKAHYDGEDCAFAIHDAFLEIGCTNIAQHFGSPDLHRNNGCHLVVRILQGVIPHYFHIVDYHKELAKFGYIEVISIQPSSIRCALVKNVKLTLNRLL
jgi:hypothetical protein